MHNTNPWKAIPTEAPYVPAEDAPYVFEYNRATKKRDEQIDTKVLPDPFSGRRDAPVVVLMNNPGLGPNDRQHARSIRYAKLLREDLASPQPDRHFHLTDPTEGPGWCWWQQACKDLIDDVGLEDLSQNLLNIDFSPYHSKTFSQRHARVRFPSQMFTFQLVQQAIDREALVICMRGWSNWLCAVPRLATYKRCLRPHTSQVTALSPGNLDHYSRVVRVIRNTRTTR